jgi:predicted flap endonuclease-1-like 5' DNA nuclease
MPTEGVSMTKLVEVEGIGQKYASALEGAGVGSIEELLLLGGTPKGREGIAEKSSLSPKLVLEWVNHADLMRIKGVGSEYADLLEEAGVDTVPELAQRNAANLTVKLESINESKNLVRRVPSESQVGTWITEAKTLPRAVEY